MFSFEKLSSWHVAEGIWMKTATAFATEHFCAIPLGMIIFSTTYTPHPGLSSLTGCNRLRHAPVAMGDGPAPANADRIARND